jgi:hypothetical protein
LISVLLLPTVCLVVLLKKLKGLKIRIKKVGNRIQDNGGLEKKR